MTYEGIKACLQEPEEYKELSSGQATRELLLAFLRNWERTRHLIFWSDHSSLMNHGQIILTVNAIYDAAFFFTSEELNGLNV